MTQRARCHRHDALEDEDDDLRLVRLGKMTHEKVHRKSTLKKRYLVFEKLTSHVSISELDVMYFRVYGKSDGIRT